MANDTQDNSRPSVPLGLSDIVGIIERGDNSLDVDEYVKKSEVEPPTRRNLIDFIWSQNALNMALVEAMAGLASDDQADRAAAAKLISDELRLSVDRNATITANILIDSRYGSDKSPKGS